MQASSTDDPSGPLADGDRSPAASTRQDERDKARMPRYVGARSSFGLRRAIDGPRCSCRPVVTRPPLRASHTLVTCERRYQAERLSQPVGYTHRATLNVGISHPWITPTVLYEPSKTWHCVRPPGSPALAGTHRHGGSNATGVESHYALHQ